MKLATPKLLFLLALLVAVQSMPLGISSVHAEEESADNFFTWKQLEKGLEFGEHQFSGRNRSSAPDVILLRVDPRLFDFRVVTAGDLGKVQSDVKTLTEHINGIVGINTNFFDEQGKELGLVVNAGLTKRNLHRGGNLLTGVFLVKGPKAAVVHREDFNPANADVATQAGPRLIAGRRSLSVSSPTTTSRRSGVAVTKTGEVILYATVTRFPGASFTEVQKMLLSPQLGVVDALNFDGGSSSQIFIADNPVIGAETLVSGGAEIPVVLVVKRKG